MNRYEVFKLLHILGAIAWVGGGLGLLALSRQLVAAKDHAGLVSLGGHSEALGARLFMPASLLTVGFGVAMVATEPAWRFTDLWILIGFGGVLGSGILQMTWAKRANERFTTLAGEHGSDHPEVEAAARRVTYGSFADVLLLVVVVWAMVAKPML